MHRSITLTRNRRNCKSMFTAAICQLELKQRPVMRGKDTVDAQHMFIKHTTVEPQFKLVKRLQKQSSEYPER